MMQSQAFIFYLLDAANTYGATKIKVPDTELDALLARVRELKDAVILAEEEARLKQAEIVKLEHALESGAADPDRVEFWKDGVLVGRSTLG